MNEVSSASPPLMEMTNQFKREIVLQELKQWNSAEQCVFLVDAMKLISFSHVKFMATFCNDMANKTNGIDSNSQFSGLMEDQANDTAYFYILSTKSIETQLKFLQLYLPLLKLTPDNRAFNEKLKDCYNQLIQNALKECLMETKFLDQCEQIIMLASVHPIFDSNQRLSLQKWLDLFQEAAKSREVGSSSNESFENAYNINQEKPNDSENVPLSNLEEVSLMVNSNGPIGPPRKSLPVEKPTLLPTRKHLFVERAVSSPMELTRYPRNNINNNLTNGLKNQNQAVSQNLNASNQFIYARNENPGMKNVNEWLKNIKLHKYTELFTQMTYVDLMEVTDEKLIKANITLGARKKILTHIDKLKDRPARLRQLIQILDDKKCPINDSTLENILIELTEISVSPIEPNKSNPTTVDKSENISFDESTNDQVLVPSGTDTCQLILELFDRIQKYLLKRQPSKTLDQNETDLKELLKVCLKIIDKLFLTKAFSDIQNLRMAKMRSSIHEKIISINDENPLFLQPSYLNSGPVAFNKKSHSLLRKSNSSYGYNQITRQTSFNSGKFNNNFGSGRNLNHDESTSTMNSVNAQQRIQNREKNPLSKTFSAPYSMNRLQPENLIPHEIDPENKKIFESKDKIAEV